MSSGVQLLPNCPRSLGWTRLLDTDDLYEVDQPTNVLEGLVKQEVRYWIFSLTFSSNCSLVRRSIWTVTAENGFFCFRTQFFSTLAGLEETKRTLIFKDGQVLVFSGGLVAVDGYAGFFLPGGTGCLFGVGGRILGVARKTADVGGGEEFWSRNERSLRP